MTLFYVETNRGDCSVITAADRHEAVEQARDDASHFPGTSITLVREATSEDVEWFGQSGGEVR